jgi:hypothetical protein
MHVFSASSRCHEACVFCHRMFIRQIVNTTTEGVTTSKGAGCQQEDFVTRRTAITVENVHPETEPLRHPLNTGEQLDALQLIHSTIYHQAIKLSNDPKPRCMCTAPSNSFAPESQHSGTPDAITNNHTVRQPARQPETIHRNHFHCISHPLTYTHPSKKLTNHTNPSTPNSHNQAAPSNIKLRQ